MLRAAGEIVGTIILCGGLAWFGQPWVAKFRKRQAQFEKEIEAEKK